MISYLITDPKYYTNNPNSLQKTLQKVFNTKDIDFACFRDKESQNFEELAKVFVDVCKASNKKSILNGNYILAKELKYSGVHLTSMQSSDIQKAKALGLYTIISTHTDTDIQKAISNGADAITYSPIYSTPNKGTPKGLQELNRACNSYDIKIIALGGITTKEHIDNIASTSAFGFASIRYFID